MSYILTIPFFAVKLHFKSGGTVIRPLLDAKKIAMNESALKLSRSFRDIFQAEVINEGDYLSLMDHYSEGDYLHSTLKVPFEAAKDGVTFPAFEIEIDFYFRTTVKGCWGMVPVLGLEAFSETENDIEERLKETIRLHFLRKRKLPLINEVIATIWFDGVELIRHDINLRFHSLKELDNISDEEDVKLIDQVATQLKPGARVVYGRKKELDQLIRVLKSKFNKNVILVGPSGVGKTALVWEVVRLLKKHRINNKIWETTASVMIKELTRDSGWQHNLSNLCEELFKNSDILFVRNLLELFEVGKYVGNDVSMADYMRSFIARGEVNMITECTSEELARIQLKNPNYTNLFQIIQLDEPKEDLEEIIIQKVTDIAKNRKVSFEADAIQETIRLNRRYTPYAGFPGKPIRFLESLLINRKEKSNIISRTEVIRSFCEETGMPQFMVDPQIPMDLNEVANFFNTNVFGQEKAVESLTGLLASVKTALMRSGKPIASLLFIGPTGVGKTEMAKILATFMFGNRERLIRFDMSEFSDPYSVMRLTGESYFSDGLLTSAVRREPFCVLLFDEIEKAHPDFYDLLLQLLSEGRLTDSSGKLVNFCSTIIIMTSNIGAENLQTNRINLSSKPDEADVTDHFLSAVQKYFRPELYNRIDQILPFKSLTKEIVRFVVDREINLFRKREGVRFRKMDLNIDKSVHDFLAHEGYDSKYGARFLQRVIREKLIIPLATALSTMDFDSQLIVNIELKDNQLLPVINADPLGFELLLEELDKTSVADRAGELRRQIFSLQEGHFYVMMLSELDILERTKEKLGERFWKNKSREKNYTFYIGIKERVNQLKNQIESIEEELSLSCLDLVPYNPGLSDSLKKWEEDLLQLKISLFAYFSPESNHFVIGIYGTHLRQILDFYIHLIESQNYSFDARTVWFREHLYNKTISDPELGGRKKAATYVYQSLTDFENLNFEAPRKGDILYGIELKIKGECCALFFQQEEGIQRWELLENTNPAIFNVVVGGEDFNTPINIHRKDFYKSAPRRIIQKDLYKDSRLALNVINPKVSYKEFFQKELLIAFKNRLENELMI